MRTLMKFRTSARRLAGWQLLLALGGLCVFSAAQAGAALEIAEFSKPGEKKTVPLNSEEPVTFNIEYFSGWSHCEVAAGTHAATKQAHAWLRFFGLDDTQIALVCQGNDKQTVVLGHKDNHPQRGSLSLICRSE